MTSMPSKAVMFRWWPGPGQLAKAVQPAIPLEWNLGDGDEDHEGGGDGDDANEDLDDFS